MLEKLDAVPWWSFLQPLANRPSTIPDEIRALGGRDQRVPRASSTAPFHDATGHDSSGVYLPVVLQTLPFLEEILREGDELAQSLVLEILLDLIGSFAPEPGMEWIEHEDGTRVLMKDHLVQRVRLLRELIEARQRESPPGSAVRIHADWLLEELKDLE
jgi:hypothetical protein